MVDLPTSQVSSHRALEGGESGTWGSSLISTQALWHSGTQQRQINAQGSRFGVRQQPGSKILVVNSSRFRQGHKRELEREKHVGGQCVQVGQMARADVCYCLLRVNPCSTWLKWFDASKRRKPVPCGG